MTLQNFRSVWLAPIARSLRSLLKSAAAIALAIGLLLGFGLDRAAIAQFRPGSGAPARAIAWEYQSISTSEESDPGNARFFRELSELGDEGFEMVTCLYAQERREDESTTVCYFKRPK